MNHTPRFHRVLEGTLAAASLLAIGPRTAHADGICTPASFDVGGFEGVVEGALGGLKGYSVSVAKDGQIVASVSGGVAVDGVDAPAPVPMDGSTPGNAGSTAKVLSSVALLHAFENDGTATVDEWLDREIVEYFPAPWREKVLDPASPPAIQDVRFVTFRDLLQHKSGLGGEYHSLILDGIDFERIGVRDYENDNIRVIGFMLAYIVDPEYGAEIDELLEGEEPSEDGLFAEYLATYFERYMQEEIFDYVETSAAPGVDIPYGLWRERLVPSCDVFHDYAGTPYFRDLQYGAANDIPFAGDVDDDGRDDLVVWRPSTGTWYARSVEGATLTPGLAYGNAGLGDIPLVGDVNGDGHDDYVLWRESTAKWYAKSASGTTLVNALAYGAAGDIPLVGNVGGSNAEDLVMWRPSTGAWYAKTRSGGTLLSGISFGASGDVPHLADVNGDGVDELVLWRPSTGGWFAYDLVSQSSVVSDLRYGLSTDTSLVGDANGDGRADLMIFRASTGRWYAMDASGNEHFGEVYWGSSEIEGTGPVTPLLGDFAGDYKDKLTLFRASNGHWSAAGRRYAESYATAASAGPGLPGAFDAELPGCYAQGGYWLSAMEFAAWAGALSSGDIISLDTLDSMFDPSSSTTIGARLGWSTATYAPAFIRTTYDVDYLGWHNGADKNFRSVLIQLPDGYYAYGFTNEGNADYADHPESLASLLYGTLVNAWIEAVDLDCEG